MGLKHATTWVFCLFFAGTLSTPCFSAKGGVALEKQQWPDVKHCEVCVQVQFGELEMHLPLSEIGKILVINSDSSALHILPKTNDPLTGVLFLTIEPEMLIKMYRKAGLLRGQNITTNEQFFDALGKPPAGKTSISKVRRIEHIDIADRYTKSSKGSLHVYWIQSSHSNSHRVYFVIDGQETVYLLAGSVTPRLYEAVLSNIRVAKVP